VLTEPTFESQFLETRPEAEIAPPTESSHAVTVALSEALDEGEDGDGVNTVDEFDGIDWKRLPGYIKPLATQKTRKKLGFCAWLPCC
jgi:hypothetical protein